MSWLFSQALVEEYLAGTCSDGEQSAPLNGNPIPQAYCAHDKMTAFSRLSRFGMTFRPLTDTLGEELLTLFRGAFLAKTSVQQDAGLESPGKNPACGNTWRESLGRYDRDTHTLKTAQFSLFEDSTLSSPTLPRWGSMRNGELFRQPTLVPPTAETESGLWGTPRVGMARGKNFWYDRGKHNLEEQVGAAEYAKMWPTPTVPNGGRSMTQTMALNGGYSETGQKRQIGLENAVKYWPTPTVCGNYNRKGLSATSGDWLATAVATWPTPTAHNAKEFNSPSEALRNEPTLAARAGGALNPTWVEWLMGWPLEWTDLKPLEMDKFQQWLQQHGVY